MNAREAILARLSRGNTPEPKPAGEPEVLDPISQFAEYAADYRATVQRIPFSELTKAIAQLAPRAVIPNDLPAEWLPGTGDYVLEEGLTPTDLDRIPAVITGCAVAIAETGTFVLDGGMAQGRRAITLIPDHHVCIIFSGQIVATIPAALALLDPTRPLTWISGPSATSDIELDRVEGVHGPRRLDILLVET